MSVLSIRRPTAAATRGGDAARRAPVRRVPAGYAAARVAHLVERTGASPATAREALAELARDGLGGPLAAPWRRGGARSRAATLRDIYTARRVFETAGLQVLLRRRPVDVGWLSAATERMGEAAVGGDGRALVEADIAFHLAIVAAAGSRRLTRAAQGALTELRLVLSVADRAGDDMPALVADHQYLVEVFRAGHLARAVAALDDHLSSGRGARAQTPRPDPELDPAVRRGRRGRAASRSASARRPRGRRGRPDARRSATGSAAEQAVEDVAAHRDGGGRVAGGGRSRR